jgi:hypothetical protein
LVLCTGSYREGYQGCPQNDGGRGKTTASNARHRKSFVCGGLSFDASNRLARSDLRGYINYLGPSLATGRREGVLPVQPQR